MPAPKPHQVMPQSTLTLQEDDAPKIEAKVVTLALIRYRQPDEREDTVQLAVVGENNVHLLNSKPLGFSDISTPQGIAHRWLADGIFAALAKKE